MTFFQMSSCQLSVASLKFVEYSSKSLKNIQAMDITIIALNDKVHDSVQIQRKSTTINNDIPH